MQSQNRIQGVLAPVLTPFGADLAPDQRRFVSHCRWLLANGCSALAVFGTTSEANSLSVDEKLGLLDALLSSGVAASALMPGTGQCALTDTVALTRRAVTLGCAGVLMLPPFYYKHVSDDGLYRYFSEVIERVGDPRLRIYLYHIPPVSETPISLGLIERLLKSYPRAIAGLKDSSGDWSNTLAVLEAFATTGFDVFTGSEARLLDNLQHGGRGCITATANINSPAIDAVYRQWQSPNAPALQAGINTIRAIVQKRPMIPALKTVLAHFCHAPAWRTVRPPLMELDAAEEAALIGELQSAGLSVPGSRAACRPARAQ